MITAAQLRAARGLLDWTRNDLAKAAGISSETVKNIEHGTFRPQETTADAIIKAFAIRDVQFTEDEGVKKISSAINILEGFEGFKAFMDDLFETAKKPFSVNGKKPICVSNVDNNLFKEHLKDYALVHIHRMMGVEGLKIRALATRKEENKVSGAGYMEARYIAEKKSLPFYVYGDKLSIINFNVDNAPRIIIINSEYVADAYRDQFEIMWDSAAIDCSK